MPCGARLDLVHKAICAGYRGQIEWQPACLERFLCDPSMQCFTDKGVRNLLWNFVRNQGGKVEQRQEKRSNWLDPEDPWWYFVVVPVPQFRDGLFIELKLLWEDGDDEDDAF